ncbi:hypothetical protein SEA_LILPHARAOH_32 [Mycobacterium phage LilPharaoh]|uniref:Helix-turn-helix DNA binding domain protein n=1 Tax=Mycobacterium phage Amelie TaxID=1913035 RepID=A0A1J0GQA2_9CAUD|nr:HTH DNA binding protein [Mycobacterium phage Amelie]APC43632.1 hypothetical protein SEA_AMELIE_32 [Mycobacterium phage Amelie]ATN90485.1 hypothetical protein SEA_LILPHARAOH_32 [Mycobacterium phage LilPharaoh]AVP42609.1 hypothetical protein SEA_SGTBEANSPROUT_32 [Mycobacterium phage SgtBeansprout]AXC37138.1 hypothetical protein SEA_BIGLEBOPS_32 [Mycobacterium phage Biglebops]
MNAHTMTVRRLSDQEAAEMARGLTVSIAGRRRTIPAAKVERYESWVEQIGREYASPEDEHRRRAAIEAVGRFLCDEDAVEKIGEELAEAREQYEAASAAARAVVLLAVEDGASELGLAQRLGINRLTVRKYRGKKDR